MNETSPTNDVSRKINSLRVVVAGSINMDLVAHCMQLPRPGETVRAEIFDQFAGGKGANQAVAAARLGAECHMIGRVGDDGIGQELVKTLVRHGVNTDAVMVTPKTSSGMALIDVEQSGENMITIVTGANGHLSPVDITLHRSLIESADVLIVQLEVPLETICAAVAIAKVCQILTVLDPAPAPTKVLPKELYAVDIMTPNQTEAGTLTQASVNSFESAAQAAYVLRERGVNLPVITLGAKGAVWIDKQTVKPLQTAAPSIKVVDTTAAGDAFTAALACQLAVGEDQAESIRFACAAGSAATTLHGAQNTMPEYDQVRSVGRIL